MPRAPTYLVRHGCAGDKTRWPGPDVDRPLDLAGMAQAHALAEELAAAPIQRILTSPAERCRQTVDPLARQLGLPVETLAELLPGGGSDRLADLVTAAETSAAAVCTHGELMAPLLTTVRSAGVRISAQRHDPDWLLQKGTAWALTVEPGGRIVALDHIAPQPFRHCPAHDPPEPR